MTNTDVRLSGVPVTPAFWGRWCGLDLQGCELSLINDPLAIESYIEGICGLLHFARFGKPNIVKFGERLEIAGYSFAQFIETSLVSGHLVDHSRCAFIDIFSCAPYSADDAECFTCDFFRAMFCNRHSLDRYVRHEGALLLPGYAD